MKKQIIITGGWLIERRIYFLIRDEIRATSAIFIFSSKSSKSIQEDL